MYFRAVHKLHISDCLIENFASKLHFQYKQNIRLIQILILSVNNILILLNHLSAKTFSENNLYALACTCVKNKSYKFGTWEYTPNWDKTASFCLK